MAVLPPGPTFAAFAGAGLLLNLVPGADMVFVTTAAARGGARNGIVAALGVGAGALGHISAAVAGLSALLAASATAFEVLRWAGVAYLFWIAVGIARGGVAADRPVVAARPWRVFRDAALVNLLNPKVALFFLALLPQFLPPGTAHPAAMVAGLGIWFNLVGTGVNIVAALLAAHAARRWSASPSVAVAARYGAAGLLGVLALGLAVERR